MGDPVRDVELKSYRFNTDRGKMFFFDIKENKNGRFLKITESRPDYGEEDGGFIRNYMTIPEKFIGEFSSTLNDTMTFLKKLREKL